MKSEDKELTVNDKEEELKELLTLKSKFKKSNKRYTSYHLNKCQNNLLIKLIEEYTRLHYTR